MTGTPEFLAGTIIGIALGICGIAAVQEWKKARLRREVAALQKFERALRERALRLVHK